MPLVVSQVPDVSPAIVIVFCSKVFAAFTVYVATYERFPALFCKETAYVPVTLERTQKDKVTVAADALPKAKSTQFKPSIRW